MRNEAIFGCRGYCFQRFEGSLFSFDLVGGGQGAVVGPLDLGVVAEEGAGGAGLLGRLGEHHRAALTLRYVDGLPVAEVADLLGRTVHATEALLVRARAAFRRTYEKGASDAV